MTKAELQSLIREEIKKTLTEAGNVPSNIRDFAKDRGIQSLVKKVATWAEKAGKRIKGGTAIGKNYGTLLLDLTYQGGEIRINTDTEEITMFDEPVNDFKSFKKVLEDNLDMFESASKKSNKSLTEAVKLQVDKMYQVYDPGMDEWQDEYEYLGYDLNSRKHMFRAYDTPGYFVFVGIPASDLKKHVLESNIK